MEVELERPGDVVPTMEVPQAEIQTEPGKLADIIVTKPAKAAPPREQRKQFFARPPSRPQPQPAPPQSRHAPPPKDMFDDFANPRKLRANAAPTEDSDSGDDDDDVLSEGSGGPPSEYSVQEPAYEEEPPEEELRPSEGFKTFDEEKADIIFKLHRLKKAGMPTVRSFGMGADIREMRSELARLRAEMDLEASIKFQRKMLMATVTGLEFLNRRFDPFDLQLDSWSEHVMDTVNDYDRVFERLHDKYKSKVSVAPEIELLFMVAGSAMMFHFTKSMLGGAAGSIPGLQINPEQMSGLMASMMKPPAANAPAAPKPAAATPATPGGRREMQAPPFDLGAMLGGATVFPGMNPPQVSSQKPSVVEMAHPSASAAQEARKAVRFASGTKRAAEEMDRVSDIASEELDSVPDDLTSFGSEPDSDTKIVSVKRGRKKGQTKTILKL